MDQVVNSGNLTEVPVPRWVFDGFIRIQEKMGPYSKSVNEMVQQLFQKTCGDGVYMGALSVVNPRYKNGGRKTKLIKIQQEVAEELRCAQSKIRELSGLNLKFEDVVANAIIFALAEVNGVDGNDLFRWFTREASQSSLSSLYRCVRWFDPDSVETMKLDKGESKDYWSFEWRI